jgi:excisionase family DNA binding protein
MQNGPNSGFYSPSQAARVLSLSKRRVLQFLERGELAGDKDPRGRWLIARADLFALQERREQEQRQRPGPKSEQPPAGEPDPALVEVLREQVEDLRGRLDVADQRDREQRRIIAALTSRIPELPSAPASPEARESDVSPGPTRTYPESSAGPQTEEQARQTEEQRPWWRRIIGS